MNKNIALGVLGVAFALLLGITLLKPAAPLDNTPHPGSVVSDTIDTQCFTQAGVKTCRQRVPMILSTTTPCAINVGALGSSTLLRASITQDVGATAIVTIARSADQFSTTTLIDNENVTASTQPVITVIATSSGTLTASKYLFGPGVGFKWLVFGVAAGTPQATAGVCSAEWQVLK